MERSRKIFHEIASAADKVITTATKYADRKDSWSVGHAHFQLEVEMRRISVACVCIADVLANSLVPGGPEFDIRLQDWLATDEPEQCRDTLIETEVLLQVQKDISSWVPRIFRRERDKAPTGDKIKEAVEHFISHKRCFYVLSLTEIWNNEKNVRRQPQDNVMQLESDGIRAKTNFIFPDLAVRQGGRADHTIQGGSNVLDQNMLVPDQMDLNSTLPDTASNEGRDTVRQKRQETMSDEQRRKEEAKFDEIVKWLDGLNCAEKQDETLLLRQPDTCKWLLDTAQYKMWRDGGEPFLWLRGKPGAGKSVLASYVISSLETSRRKEGILAFFYCDFRSERSTSSAEALRSILSQLLRELQDRTVNSGSLLDDLVKAKERGGFTRNNTKALAVFASRVAMLSNEKPLVIVDALDECNDVTSLLQALMQIKDHIRLFVTSRPLHIIMCGLSGLPFISMDDMEDELSTDIELHVTRELDARHRLRDIDTLFKAEIRSVLCGKAGGMFRWIQCSIDTLDRCVTRKEVRSALDSLPEGLDGTYERILLAIDTKRREGQLARRALTWLVAALRPLRLSELIEGLSINLETRTLDLDFGPMHSGVLLDACGSLVIYNEKTGFVILSHFSVKEYLMGELILKKLPQYYIDRERAHIQLARSCMCHLTVHLNSPPINVPVSGRREHVKPQPLRDYVLNNAIDHFRHLGSQFESVLPDIKVLAHDIQEHSRLWNNLCRSAGWDMDSATPMWPASKHDLILYLLVAYAPNSLLRSFLRHTPLKPKEGTNPLVYAAHFNKGEHARTLLLRGGRLNRRGWDVNGFFRVFPIEAALQTCHYSMVTLFVEEGSTIPPHIFTNSESYFPPHGPFSTGIPSSIARILLQTDNFLEVVNNPLNGVVSQPMVIFNCLLTGYEGNCEDDLLAIVRRFNQAFDDQFLHGHNSNMLLPFAVERGHVHLTRYLFSVHPSHPSGLFETLGDWKTNVRAPMVPGEPVLHTALWSFQNEHLALETVKLLVSLGYDPFETTTSGTTLLHIAEERGFTTVIRYLQVPSLGKSPFQNLLHIALGITAEEDKARMITFLLENGANVHARTVSGDSVLHTTLRSFRNEYFALETVKILVGLGCDPLEANSSGKTPLSIAIEAGFVSVVQIFLSLGASLPPNLLDTLNRCQWDEWSMIQLLVRNGVHARTAGEPLLHTILQSSWREGTALEAVKTLVGHGYDPLEASSSGKMLLQIAVEHGYLSVAQYLFSLGASLPPDVFTMLHPSRRLTVPMIRLLAENGTNFNIDAAAGEPVFHVVLRSFWNGNDALEATKVLVTHGCNPLEDSSSGNKLLQIAVERGFLSVAQYLLSLGASLPPENFTMLDHRRLTVPMIRLLAENGTNFNIDTIAGEPVLHVILQSFWNGDDTLEATKVLVTHGYNPLEGSFFGNKLLQIAVERGFLSVAQYLLSLGASLPPDMFTMLDHRRLTLPMIRFLVENGTDVHTRTSTGEPVLHLVLRSFEEEGDALEATKALIRHGCDPQETSSSGKTPLHIAVESGFLSVAQCLLLHGASLPHNVFTMLGHQDISLPTIQFLIKNGANVHTCTPAGEPVLHAILQSMQWEDDALEATKALIRHGCDPRETSSSGNTPLRIAVKSRFLSVAQYLLSLGASLPSDVFTMLDLWDRPLTVAMVRFLVENGANVHIRTLTGEPVLHAILQSMWEEPEDDALEATKVLISHDCDPQETCSSGNTPLCIAAEHGFVSVVQYLLSLGIPCSSDLLHIASKSTNEITARTIVFLLENGADIHARTTAGDLVLHALLKAPSGLEEEYVLETVKVLVCHGCDPLETNSSGKSPLHIAIERGFVPVARYFISLGALPSSDLLFIALLSRTKQEQLRILRWLKNGLGLGANIPDPRAAVEDFVLLGLHSFDKYQAPKALKETLKFLLALGCNPFQPNSQGEIPLCVALEKGYTTIARIFLALCAPSVSPCDVLWVVLKSSQFRHKLQAIDFLTGQGVNVLAKTESGDSVLHVAIASVSFDEILQVVELLLRRGCDPRIPNPRGATPFHVAVERGCLSVVNFFLWLNDIPLPPDILFTAIQPSSIFGSSALDVKLEIVKALVTAGCRTQIRNAAGLTPLDVAYSEGCWDVVGYLLTAPVPTNVSEEE